MFSAEVAEANRRRLAVLLPLMIIAHAIHAVVFMASGAERAALSARLLRWHDLIALIHVATGALAVPLALVARRPRSGPMQRALAPAAALLYLLHGALIAGADQLTVTSVTPFVGYALGTAVVLCLSPATAMAIYGAGLAAFVAAILSLQPSATARLAELPNGFSIAGVSVALSWILFRARERDYAQRQTIEEQRRALEDLNASLEQRLNDKIAEAMKRAAEVDRLNVQIQGHVRLRSSDLSAAIAKLDTPSLVPASLAPNTVLDGRFEVGERIGEGGMGVVYAGVDRSTGEAIAIKTVHAGSGGDRESLLRFVREAASAATVTHPAVVRVLHVDLAEGGTLYQIQELVQGVTLRSRMHDRRPWPAVRVARFTSVLFDALAAAHAAGVVHRDVKPGNIMLTTAAPGMKLLDFGIAKLYAAFGGDSHTRSGVLVGTPDFMAPELLVAEGPVTGKADVYAAGVVAFLLLTGRHPFRRAATRLAPGDSGDSDAPDPRRFEAAIPGAVADLVSACLRWSPDDRPSARELSRALSVAADMQGAPALEVVVEDLAREQPLRASVAPPTIAEGKLDDRLRRGG